jgi:GH15 family glucan-1,4-alpha-glucosidase
MTQPSAAYLPIENYGIVGDMHTVALVGKNGAIDWFCYPRFDSPSLFAALLDAEKGGTFRIEAHCDRVTHRQFYWPDTNVLVTRFLSGDGVGEVVDFMPVGRTPDGARGPQLIRRVRTVRGSMRFGVVCRPAFDYAREPHEVLLREGGATFHTPSLDMALRCRIPLETDGDGGVTGEITLEEGQRATLVFERWEDGEERLRGVAEEAAGNAFRRTVDFWTGWLGQSTYTGRWRETVHRSALCLKLLTYAPTGAIVAAPTCSLPEGIGGGRNWDYRYTWIRDAAFTLYALMRIGFTEEAGNFMRWIEARCHELASDGSLKILYGIDGRHDVPEHTLDHLAGYRGSRPVRIGNGAAGQLQLDIYGELMDSVYLYNKYGSPISYDLWKYLRRLLDWVCNHWQEKDAGIWEVRGGHRHFVYSKLMCWVALDRGLRLAEKRSFPAPRERWLAARDAIYEEIFDKGWSRKRKSFVQAYGSDALDAANLVMPLVFFVSPTDDRMLETLDAILKPPHKGGLTANSLVYRYNPEETDDGVGGEDGTFNICTFWLVEAMTRSGRVDPDRLSKARLIFEEMLGYANHLGLFAEETGLHGEALGNFPQAFTHLALISAAFNLDRALGGGG